MRRLLLLLPLVLLMLPALLPADTDKAPKKFRVYVGTYTSAKGSQGIYKIDLDPATGKLGEPVLAGKAVNPSFVAIHPSKKFLYAVGEIDGKKGGAVTAFSIDEKTGDLTMLNQESSIGGGPCHIVIDAKGKNALAANYGGGSHVVLPIGADGKLAATNEGGFVQHKGKSIEKNQSSPHAHSINLDAANLFAFVADLGLDKILVYKFDADKGTITPNDPPAAEVKPGSGPRHFAFHPSGKHAYVINEMALTLTAFDYDAKAGVLKSIQTISTVPEVASRKGFSTAEVVVHPSGKFVYGSNRGHNSIAVFAVDKETGKLTAKGHQGKGIKTPRNFAIEPTGKFLLVANQDGGSVIVFEIDQATGELKPTDHSAKVANPVCLRFVPAE